MGSQTLALVFRALRVDARQLPSHVMRLALIGFVLLMLLWAQALSIGMGAPGLWYFTLISYTNLVFATLAGPLLFATCITEEKEEQTIGLLRMANIGPLSLLLGKLAPRLASTLLILVVQFPFTLLAITLGGVSWMQVYSAFCSLLAHVFLVANIGLLCSVVARHSGRAVGLCAVALFSGLVLPGILYALFSAAMPPPGAGSAPGTLPALLVMVHQFCLVVSEQWFEATAIYQLFVTLTTGFSEGPFNAQVLSNLTGGAVAFLLSWALFDAFNRNVDVASPSNARTLVGLLQRRGRAPARAWTAAIVGREFRFAAGGYSTWIIKLILYGFLAWFTMAISQQRVLAVNLEDLGGILMSGAMFVVFPIEATVLASRLFRSEIKDKTWSTLYMLPRTLPAIAYSKLGGALLALVPIAFCFLVGAQLYPQGVNDFLNGLDDPHTIVAIVLMIAHLVLYLHLVAWYSVLTNAWTGILLALLTWVGGLVFWSFLTLIIPMLLGITANVDPMTWSLVVNGITGAMLLAIAVALHLHIAARLRAAAAL